MKARFVCFLQCRSGATAIEYGLLATGLSVAIYAAAKAAGGTIDYVLAGVRNSVS
ncbi:MAG: Flp family type IVb pilin [Rhodoblastus sp.]